LALALLEDVEFRLLELCGNSSLGNFRSSSKGGDLSGVHVDEGGLTFITPMRQQQKFRGASPNGLR